MFESFGRGFRMIGASIKMGWQDKRLMLPSILTVLTNIFFGLILMWQAVQKLGHHGGAGAVGAAGMSGMGHPTHGMLRPLHHHGGLPGGMPDLGGMTALNGPFDPSGFGSFTGSIFNESTLFILSLMILWWTTNRFLEGVTTALVYSHLTEGKGSGRFSQACGAVLSSLPAILMLGLVTLIAKRIAGWMRDRRNTGVLGFGFNFLASIVEVFWTLAGHLILPAIVIEGTSFWGALKRADKIAQGNLLTIGVGEVGVDAICRFTTLVLYSAGVGGLGYAYWAHVGSPLMVMASLLWACSVVVVTSLSIYIRAAFYTCLYVWAINAEAVQETERVRVKPPEPLAAALA